MDKVYTAYHICAGVLFSVTPSGSASEGVWDYLCYSLLIALSLINSIFNHTLWSLTIFLMGIIMDKHLLVQNIYLLQKCKSW